MTAEELLVLIRRDIGDQIQTAVQFRLGNHLAANMRAGSEISAEINSWIDALTKNNITPDNNNVAGSGEGTLDSWRDRAYSAEAKLDHLREILR